MLVIIDLPVAPRIGNEGLRIGVRQVGESMLRLRGKRLLTGGIWSRERP